MRLCNTILGFSSLLVALLLPTQRLLAEDIILIAYDGQHWYPYLLGIDPSIPTKIKTHTKIAALPDVRHVTRDPKTSIIYFESIDGRLGRLKAADSEVEWLEPLDVRDVTQIRVFDNVMFMVELVDGKSGDTHIGRYDLLTKRYAHLFKQESSQFLPFITEGVLYYSNVSCRLACDPLIQDIWAFNLRSLKTRQITMLNAITSLHSATPTYGYISSNAEGHYRIGRINFENNYIQWLTDGASASDSHPYLSESGALYFLRNDMKGTHLMVINDPNEKKGQPSGKFTAHPVSLPNGIQKIRYLEGKG